MTAIANGQVDPRDLKPHQLQALRLVANNRLTRKRNGYRGIGKAVITLDMFDTLSALGLIRRELEHGVWRVKLTGKGNITLGVADVRKRA